MTTKTAGEQLADLEATRAARVGRMQEITNKTLEGNRTKDQAESEEFNTLHDEVKSIDAEIKDLNALEAIQMTKATPVPKTVPGQTAKSQEEASNARGNFGQTVQVDTKLAPGVAFARFAGVMAHTKGNFRDALDFASNRFPDDNKMAGVIKMFSNNSFEDITKAAVAVGTTSDAAWAKPLVVYNQMAEEFIEFVRPQTIVGNINARRVPFNISMPRQTTGGSAYWVGEGNAKPVTSLAFDQVTLKWTKLATIAVISQELARFSQPSAETILRDQLAAAVIQQMDSDFINPANAGTADVKPASITNGVTAVASAAGAGSGEAGVRGDIKALFAPFIAANLSPQNGVWIMSATSALTLSLMVNALGQPSFPGISMNGGTFWGMPVVVSEAVGNIVVLANANDILLADDGQVSIDASSEASLQMDTAPDNPTSATTVMVSLWQRNLLAIRAERYVNWTKARAASVQYLSGVNWDQPAAP